MLKITATFAPTSAVATDKVPTSGGAVSVDGYHPGTGSPGVARQ